jgi:hypothetical protein
VNKRAVTKEREKEKKGKGCTTGRLWEFKPGYTLSPHHVTTPLLQTLQFV